MAILSSLFIICLLSVLNPLRCWERFTIWRWKRALMLEKHGVMFQKISANHHGFILSREARRDHDALDYVYGEIDFIPFIALLSLTKPNPNTVFYDLGSGTGKAVFACAMVFQVKKSCGIELFAELHAAALAQKQQLLCIPEYEQRAKCIHFIQDNFLHANINDATLIFINSTGYFGDSWLALNHRLDHLTSCKTIITTSKQLASNRYTVHHVTTVQMSWGVVKAYIHARV